MKNILSRQNRHLLEQFAWSNVLLAFDYDGTLAPIAEDPDRAFMRLTTRELLQKMAKRYPCIVISGRAQDDALRKLRGSGVYEVIGNHGLEPRHATGRLLDQVQRWLPVIEPAVADYKRVVIENKLFSLAVHCRRSREKKKARAAILHAARSLDDTRIIGGKWSSISCRHMLRARASRSNANAIVSAATLLSTSATTKRTKMYLSSISRGAS